MLKKMRTISLVVLFILLCSVIKAQKASIKKVELAGEKIIVYYDLEESNPNTEFQIFLYSSQNNFTTALSHVKGDVGNEVKSGYSKKIEWSVREELGPYKGKLALEVRGKVYAPFAKIQNFDVSKKYKRGKTYPLQWKAGSSSPIHIELYKGSERVIGELNHPNNGSYSLSLPPKIKSGSDYRIKITDSKNSDEIVYSDYFKVVHKIPLALKVVPVLVVGGVAAVVLKGGGGSGENPNPGESGSKIDLPDFPSGN
jgi:hypothetical protein